MRRPKKAARRKLVVIPVPVMVKIADLNEAKYNPRHISSEEMRSLEASILKYGMVEPLVVRRRGMSLIAGHQRLTALRNIAARGQVVVPEEIPANVLDVTHAIAKALNVALNRIGGEFDADKLDKVISSIVDSRGFEPVAIGFDQAQVDEMVRRATAVPPVDGGDSIDVFAKSVTMTVSFGSVEQRDEARRALEALCGRLGEKPGAVVFRLVTQALLMQKSAPPPRRLK